jgi:hypothetical protein
MSKKLVRYFLHLCLHLSATITAVFLCVTAYAEVQPIARSLNEAGISTQPLTPEFDAFSPSFTVEDSEVTPPEFVEVTPTRPLHHFPHPLTAEDIEAVEIATVATPADFTPQRIYQIASDIEIKALAVTSTPQLNPEITSNIEIKALAVTSTPQLNPEITSDIETEVLEAASTPPTNHFPYPLLAQEIEAEVEVETVETSPPLTPRFGGQFTTGPGSGYGSSYSSVYGWLPFAQTPGNSVAFAEGRFNIATEGGRLGGNLLLGYRSYLESSDLVWGAYLGYDIRSNNSQTYHQLGTGADMQTGIWEARLNAYFPIANTQATVAESTATLSSTATNPRFVGNYLQFTQTNQIRRDRITDSALTGVDLEAGAKLYDWDGGDLRGYLGTYVYGGENISTFVGFRSRLVARPTPNTNLGLTLQTDGEFGTNLILSVGASFGGSRSSQRETTVVNRLSEGMQRQSQIALARRSSSTTTTTTTTTNATNPTTGQPWFFRHVSSTAGSGSGTFESPYNSITEALTGISSDGNQIVYVQGSGTFAGNLNIASNVQLLSTGPSQQINTTSGTITLPLSGSGNFPTINGQVVANTNSVFNGFNLTGGLNLDGLNGTTTLRNLNITVANANESGISCNNISGTAALNLESVTINVNGVNSNGIRCTNVAGNLTINGGTVIKNNNQFAIFLQNISGAVALSGMNITANNGGLLQGNTINNLAITNSTLVSNNAPGNGIDLENVTGTATIAGNTGSRITGAATEGVSLRNSTGTINLSGLEIANVGQNAVRVSNVSGTLNVSNNNISSPGDRAFYLVNTAGNLNLTIANNVMTNSRVDGVRVDLNNTANLTATVSGNTINGVTDAAGDAFDFEAIGNSRLDLTLTNNTISNSGNSAIELEVQGTGILNSTITNNTITNSGGDGILFLHNSSQNVTMTVSNNTITNSGTANNGISNTPGAPFGNTGNGGFGLSAITLANGNLTFLVEGNTITDSQDAKIGIAANPDNLVAAFAGSSRIDARVRFNVLSGTGGGALPIPPLNSGSFGALVDSNATVCLQLQNNTANDINGAGYLLVNLNPGTAVLQQDTANTGNTGTFVSRNATANPLVFTPTVFTTTTCNLP